MTPTTDISILGLGAMGAALARAQLDAGHAVTVWNRSAGKAAPLAEAGARVAATCAEAVAASPVIMVSLLDYPTAEALLRAPETRPHLVGRTVIQLSTGAPREPRDAAAWLADAGAAYVDGAIKFHPDKVGAPEGVVHLGGAPEALARAMPFLRPVGGDLRVLGDNVAAAAALDLGLLAVSVALHAGVAQGARICAAEGVGVDHLAAGMSFGPLPRNRAEIIHAGAYDLLSLHSGATLEVWADVVRQLRAQARDAGISAELPDALGAIYDRAVAAGFGAEDIAALYKVLAAPAP